MRDLSPPTICHMWVVLMVTHREAASCFTKICKVSKKHHKNRKKLHQEFLKVTVSQSCNRATNFWLYAKSWDLHVRTKHLCILTSFEVFLLLYVSHISLVRFFLLLLLSLANVTCLRKINLLVFFLLSFFILVPQREFFTTFL